MSDSGIFPADDWTVARGTGHNGPILTRYRSGMPSSADRALFSNLIIIRWQYADTGAGSLPDDETLDAMTEFEDAVLDAAAVCIAARTFPHGPREAAASAHRELAALVTLITNLWKLRRGGAGWRRDVEIRV